jgi:MscS family membrane protein
MNWQKIKEFLSQQYWENSLGNILTCIGILLFGLLLRRVFGWIVSRFVYKFLEKQSSEHISLSEFLKLLRKPLEWLFLLIIIYVAFLNIEFPASWNLVSVKELGLRMIIQRSFYILLIVSLTRILLRFADYFGIIFIRRAEKTETTTDNQIVPFIREVAKVFIVLFAFLFSLGTVFGLDVASVIAGLGIGGLAVALAAKESLENLFASFTIFLDKPFVAGDVIKVGEIQGTIEKVGFRSTRLRTLDKSFLTVPNKMLIDQALDNLSYREFRRAKFTLQLQYDTPVDAVKKIIADIRKTLATHAATRAEEASIYFDELGESSLKVLIIFFVNTADWGEFMQVKEEMNFKIIEIVQNNGAEFAFPSRKVYVQSDNFPAANQFSGKILKETEND